MFGRMNQPDAGGPRASCVMLVHLCHELCASTFAAVRVEPGGAGHAIESGRMEGAFAVDSYNCSAALGSMRVARRAIGARCGLRAASTDGSASRCAIRAGDATCPRHVSSTAATCMSITKREGRRALIRDPQPSNAFAASPPLW